MIQNLLEEILEYLDNGYEERLYDEMGNRDKINSYCNDDMPWTLVDKIKSILEQINAKP